VVDALGKSFLVAVSNRCWGHGINPFNLEFHEWAEVFADSNMLFNNVLRVSINNSISVLHSILVILLSEFLSSFLSKLSGIIKSFFVEVDVVDNLVSVSRSDSEESGDSEFHIYNYFLN